ncbi:MAG TPA: PAS domain S-box protein [Dongiaceae bacterium]|nr:PAS domain S-box protein [Dongiaceae bacterium]
MRPIPWGLAGAVFLLDVLVPSSVAVGILYVIPLLLACLWWTERRMLLLFAGVCTALTVAGAVAEPGDLPPTVLAANRLLSLAVFWTTAVLCLQRRGAERRRRLTEEQLHGVLASAMDAIITVDAEQRITLFNPAAERMFGCPAAEALGQSLDRFIPARFREAHRDHIRRFGSTNVTSRRMGALGQVIGLRADGEEFPVEASISHLDVEGQKLYTVILRDITRRVKAERELQHERDFIAAVLDTAGALVVVFDREGRIVRFNRACERTSGYAAEEVMGKPVWDFLLAPEDIEPAKAAFEEVKGAAAPHAFENDWVTKDGRRRRISWLSTHLLDDRGQVEYVIGTGLDTTDIQQVREQLRRTERLAELGMLASGMAHEIGTPMNVILGRAEYLLSRTKEEPTKRGLETIVAQVERITKIMNQLLAFARRRPAERRPLDLRKSVADCLDVIQERVRRHRIRVETDLPADLPPVLADADQVSQVLLNLMLNAIQAMPEGGTLRLALARGDGTVTIQVGDTGHGIPEEALSKIFLPFYTTKEVGKGTGLGLTVVHGIIQEHGGTITVESRVDQGTTFTVALPIAET